MAGPPLLEKVRELPTTEEHLSQLVETQSTSIKTCRSVALFSAQRMVVMVVECSSREQWRNLEVACVQVRDVRPVGRNYPPWRKGQSEHVRPLEILMGRNINHQ